MEALNERLERIKTDIEERRANTPPCPKHPQYREGDCWVCNGDTELAAQLEADERERATILEEAGKCWEKFPRRYQHAATDRADVLEWVAKFHADPRSSPSLLLLGPTGTGKTYQAYGAVRAAVTHVLPLRAGGYRAPRWKALTYADLCASLRPRGKDYDPEATLEKYRQIELLFVDDLGAAKTTEFVEEATYRLINGRYEDMRPSIFTANLGLPELREAIGDRIASRLSETCVRVVLEGSDRRRNPPGEVYVDTRNKIAPRS
jgi:DNA replication protein DnaC